MPILPIIVRYIIFTVVVFAVAVHAQANTVHNIRFTQKPILVIWENNQVHRSHNPIRFDPVHSEASSKIPGSGHLIAVDMPADQPLGRTEAFFDVATNTRFAIRADIRLNGADPNSVFEFQRINVGPNAFLDTPDVLAGRLTLQELQTDPVIYVSKGKTARAKGDPYSQSHAFHAEWYDTQAEISFEVFVP